MQEEEGRGEPSALLLLARMEEEGRCRGGEAQWRGRREKLLRLLKLAEREELKRMAQRRWVVDRMNMERRF